MQEYAVGLFDLAPTKSAIKKAIKKSFVSVNGKIAATSTLIVGGETIILKVEEPPKPKRKLVYPLEVLYEDEYLALIHKPAGIEVSGNSFITVAHALEQNLARSTCSDACHPQTIHRLDYPTTGLLLVGKTNNSIRALHEIFERKNIQKTYLAITIGEMKGEGAINTMVDEKEAISNYSVLASVSSERFGQLNLVKLEPETGRRHQLRVHLSSIGHPILGDREYGEGPLILNRKGLYLHAYCLEFIHPVTEVSLRIVDPKIHRFKKIFHEFDWDSVI